MPTDSLECAVERLPAGWRGHYFDAVESTQDQARAAAERGALSRSVFVADCQRAGRGRHGRTWSAAPGSALLMSLLFRDSSAEPRPFRYTRALSLSVLDSICQLMPGAPVAIKWPNDVMLADQKVAGVLAETAWSDDQLRVIVGVGINVSSHPDVPGATCLARIAPVDRGTLLHLIVQNADLWLAAPEPTLHADWERRLWRRGQRLHLLDLGEQFDVVVLGAADDGSLHVRLPSGEERYTTTGELLA